MQPKGNVLIIDPEKYRVSAWLIHLSDSRDYVYCGTETAARSFVEGLAGDTLSYRLLEVKQGDYQKV
jgi:hypothetical protein